ncbi:MULTISPECIES: substrate-binding domain-containing protein [unclassified Vibrio]|uniref:Autoinducer 2-binding periplasmic protein LuxP n=1 Tax=Vibrio sp. HB236076 TaxID=3232307 RepID=A0AB39HAN9_9VIBR|nr:substrate-binding domain-containing protein [Vibrio sp. HB161653]MDP5254246.1 substrate-binding domain-containing protein [Vibrio sp. HB161653]
MKMLIVISTVVVSVFTTAPTWANSTNDYIQHAKSVVKKASSTQFPPFTLPNTPQAAKNKTVIFVTSDLKNNGVLGVVKGFMEASRAIGWKTRIIDGAGTFDGQYSALEQAISLNPDGIVVGGFNPDKMETLLKKSHTAGIKTVAWHASPDPGPMPKYYISTNITSSSDDVAKVSAMYAIADSNGRANVVILTDSAYKIAIHKAKVMEDYIKKCRSCKVLNYIDEPLAKTSSRIPKLTYNLIQDFKGQYGYTLAINDLYFDYMAPTLHSLGKNQTNAPKNISAGDGSQSAFERIRNKDFQVATVAEPLNLHGWQTIDELNRLFNKKPISNYVTPVHLVTPDNIDEAGGDRNTYDPDNGYREFYSDAWNQ